MNSISLQMGKVGPALFVIVFTVSGWVRPDYSTVRMPVSALSLGPLGWIQILNFVIVGISFVVFSFALLPVAKGRSWSRILPVLLFLIGCSLAFSGLFTMDAPDIPRTSWTFHGWMHQILGATVFLLFPTCCFVSSWTVRHSRFRRWSFVVGCFIVVSIFAMKVAQLQGPEAFLFSHFGILQRVAIVSYMFWVITLAFMTERASKNL
ncbi:PF06197 family protein [Leptospira fainei serovar Hurstbridge str. BUT 6]|uniref:PF06197 family protein n=1 Tax=Leptospira fainei serovar Hurstbridge str. BUT 6 TaxID=1193011 RepID=S3VX07_9LEPT|nr:DUF998 domain-containing protein [Leptospira fainei]EPG72672.1 PF06197 family protein [Leptospira fainei serovar Hurstbridge str. BUT 6]